jgi:hypothetical protein
MSQKVINIGIQGNDGTGDSIRASFDKVNKNFTELYAIFGEGGAIGFTALRDAPSSYTADQVIMASHAGGSLTARTIRGEGIDIITDNNDELVLRNTAVGLEYDIAPKMAGSIDARGAFTIGNLPDPSEALVTAFEAIHNITIDIGSLPVTVNYANEHFITQDNGIVTTALRPRAEPASPQVGVEGYDPTLSSNYLSTEALPRKNVVYRGGDTMTGALNLSDHPSPLTGAGIVNGSDDLQAASKFYVDNSTYFSGTNLYVSTTKGDDLQRNTPPGRQGRAWQYAYKTIGAAALQAQNLISISSSEPGPYRQRIAYTVGPTQTSSTITGVSLSGGNTQTVGYVNATNLLTANKTFIQTETIAYLNKKYVNTFTYDKVAYAEIIRALVSGVGYDLVLGTNYNSTTQAQKLFNAYNAEIITSQLVQILDAVNYAKTEILNYSYSTTNVNSYIDKVVNAVCYDLVFGSNYQSIQVGYAFSTANTSLSVTEITAALNSLRDTIIGLSVVSDVPSAVESITNNFGYITTIIKSGTAPTPVFNELMSTTDGQNSAKELLINNIPFIQSEIIAYLLANYPTLAYSAATCRRDVKMIVESLVYDLMYGGNSQSAYAGLRYWIGNTLQIQSSEVNATNSAVGYINTLAQAVISNTRPSIVYQQSVAQYTNETLTGGTTASAGIATHIAMIQGMITSVSTPTPTIVAPTLSAAPTELTAIRTALLATPQLTALKTSTNDFITTTFPVINNAGISSTISGLFDIVTSLITNGIDSRIVPSYTNPIGIASGYANSKAAIIANKNFIISETIAWVLAQSQFTGVAFDQAALVRDTTYLLEAVCYDLAYGGNSATVQAAAQYVANSANQSIAGVPELCAAAVGHAQTIITQLVIDTPINPVYQYSDLQVHNSAWVASDSATNAINTINGLFNSVKDVIRTDASYAVVFPSTVGYDATTTAARNIIEANAAQVAIDTNLYLSSTYVGGFTYNESTCFRDIGFIIDGMISDLLTGGTYQSINAGKSYYRNSSAATIAIGTQYTETLDGLTFAKNLALQVLNQTRQRRYQTLVTQTAYNGSALAGAPAIADFTTNYNIMLGIIQHGYGSAPTPSYGTGLYTVTFSNGGRGYVDQGGIPVAGQQSNIDIIPGKILVGNTSGAYGKIVTYTAGNTQNYDTVTLRLTRPTLFTVGETIDFGETVSDVNIMIHVETGVYYEDYPIRIPANVTIAGDDSRRTIVRPKDRPSQSPWRSTFFYRDAIIDSMQIGLVDYTTDLAAQLSTPATLSGTTGTITISLDSSFQAPASWVGLVITDATSGSVATAGKAVINTVSGNVLNCSVVYPFATATTYAAGTWHLYGTTNYGRHYLTNPLDITSTPKNNRDIDVFLCNDATRIKQFSCQGHGGFMMVLDPEGQIKTKSPYAHEVVSFSGSNNRQRFAGGMFIDGFTGRLFGTVTDIINNGITVTVTGGVNSGLDLRPPQTPCAFYVAGTRYQINDIVSWNQTTSGGNVTGGVVTMTLDPSTPFLLQGVYNSSTFDFATALGSSISALAYDAAFGSNYQSIKTGLSYLLPQNAVSALGTVLIKQGLAYAGTSINSMSLSTGAKTLIKSNLTTIIGIITGGTAAVPTITYPTPATLTSTSPAVYAVAILQANRTFAQAEVTAWLGATYNTQTIPRYNTVRYQREVGYAIDAVCYDLLYGGTSSVYDMAKTYFVNSTSQIPGEETAFAAAYGRLSTILQQIVANTTVTKSAGNQTAQITSLPAAGSQASPINILVSIITNTATNIGNSVYNVAGTRTLPTYTSQPLQSDTTALLGSTSAMQTSTISYLNTGAGIGVNVEMGGNKSMLASNFTQVNDLGYGILATNSGLTEQVSTFTYYCYTGMWALNGAQVRSVGCSNSAGNYGLRASGYDVTELPDSVSLTNNLVQSATVYKQGAYITSGTPSSTVRAVDVYINSYEYIPTSGSELEIDHTAVGGDISRYIVTTISHTGVTINGKNILQLSLSTAGTGGTSGSGLTSALYDGQVVTIRALQNMKFNGINNVKPVRPSTALQYNSNLSSIYRIVAYNLTESSGEQFPLNSGTAILQMDSGFSYYVVNTDAINNVKADPTYDAIGLVNGGSTASTTISLLTSSITGSIVAGYTVGGIGFTSQKVVSTSISGANTLVVVSAVPSLTPVGQVYFSAKTQGSQVSDTKISIGQIVSTATINQLNRGNYVFGWNGRTHRVISYTGPTFVATGSVSGYTAGTRTLTVTGVSGTIVTGTIVTGTGFDGTQYVQSVSTTTAGTTVNATIVLTVAAASTPSGTISFGAATTGYLTIDANPVYNNSAIGTQVKAMTYTGQALQTGSTVAKVITYSIPYSSSALLPPVDSYLTVTGNATPGYNGSFQIVGITNTTQITTSSTSTLSVGMVLAAISTSTAYVPSGTIIQSIDSSTQFTVSPACWVPSGTSVTATLVATLASITIVNGGSGYTVAPTITLVGGGYISQAVVTCSIDSNGSIVSYTIVNPGYGYTSTPTVSLSTVSGGAQLTAALSTSPTSNITSTGGTSSTTMSLLYPTDPGLTGTTTSVTSTGNYITLSATAYLTVNSPITFSGTAFGNLAAGTTYYILTINTGTNQITVSATVGGAAFVPGTATGVMTWYSSGFAFGTSITATGFGSKSVISGTSYAVTLNFSSTTAPTVGAYYRVSGNTNTLYNGFWIATASTTTSVTLTYPFDPGTWSTATTTTIAKETTNGTSSTLGLSKPFSNVKSSALRIGYASGSLAQITVRISTCRASSHDFLDIGTGGFSTTNFPNQIYGNPTIASSSANQVVEETVGRVFHVSTDENGIFRIGRFFTVDQGTGTVSISQNVALNNVAGLGFQKGVIVTEFSTEGTMTENASDKVPVQSAIRTFIDYRLGLDYGGNPSTTLIGPGYLPLNGLLAMKSNLNMGNNYIGSLYMPVVGASPFDGANRQYVDTGVASVNSLFKLNDMSIVTPATGNHLVYDAVAGKWKNTAIPVGDVNVTYSSASGTLTTAIQAGKIFNSMVNTNAAIAQSKLAMTAATTRTATGGTGTSGAIVQADLGLATFKDTEFNAANGWISLQSSTSSTTGIVYSKLQYMPSGTILGNRTGLPASPSDMTPVTVVTDGNAVSNAPFTSLGVMTVTGNANTTFNSVTNTGGGNTYGVTPITTTAGSSSIIKSGTDASVDVGSLKLNGNSAISLSGTTIQYTTPGAFKFMTSVGTASTGTTTTYGTFDTSNGTLKASAFTTGGVTTSGTIVGKWAVQVSSSIDFSLGTLLSTSLSTGATGTTGSVIGTWTIGSGSTFVATSVQGQANSATITASTTANGQIVLRDANGNFSAGTITAALSGNATTATSVVGTSLTGTNEANLVYSGMADNDFFRIRVGGTATNSGWAEIATADDGTEPIYVRQYSGAFTTVSRTAALLDGSGNTSFPGTVTAPTFSGALSGRSTYASYADEATNNTFYIRGTSPTINFVDNDGGGAGVPQTRYIHHNSQLIGFLNKDGNWIMNVNDSGTVSATLFSGTATSARYADLAERYEADAVYEIGTVLVFGGDKEITTTTQMNDTRVAGVVSTNPAYMMNSEAGTDETHPYVALAGRVPCKVVGRVKKGDMLTTSATPGYACKAIDPKLGSIIGKALENKDYGEAGVIEVAVGRT